MTKEQAIQAMKKGERVRHRFFTSDEHIFLKGEIVHDEDGFNLGTISDFFKYRKDAAFDNDWEIV